MADGLAATARVITAAAAIMVCVFGASCSATTASIKLFGLGLAVAVFIDATIVRLVLVPATMELLGDRNWWLPKWLDRILPQIHVEAHPEDHPGSRRLPATDRDPRPGTASRTDWRSCPGATRRSPHSASCVRGGCADGNACAASRRVDGLHR